MKQLVADLNAQLERVRLRLTKPFALGVRVEHPQALIDQAQYRRAERGLLPAASYSLVHQTEVRGEQRGVFSFCMCPGGFIVPAATAPGEVVVNGMSPSRRDSRFAPHLRSCRRRDCGAQHRRASRHHRCGD